MSPNLLSTNPFTCCIWVWQSTTFILLKVKLVIWSRCVWKWRIGHVTWHNRQCCGKMTAGSIGFTCSTSVTQYSHGMHVSFQWPFSADKSGFVSCNLGFHLCPFCACPQDKPVLLFISSYSQSLTSLQTFINIHNINIHSIFTCLILLLLPYKICSNSIFTFQQPSLLYWPTS